MKVFWKCLGQQIEGSGPERVLNAIVNALNIQTSIQCKTIIIRNRRTYEEQHAGEQLSNDNLLEIYINKRKFWPVTANFPGHFPGSGDTGVKLPDIPGQALFRESENPNPNPNPNLKPHPNPNPNPNLIPNPKSEPESIKNNYFSAL